MNPRKVDRDPKRICTFNVVVVVVVVVHDEERDENGKDSFVFAWLRLDIILFHAVVLR